MNFNITIRGATSGDAAGILHCLACAFESVRDRYTPEGFADTTLTPETIRQRLASMSVFVAMDDQGHIIGTIACSLVSPKEGHLRGMAVLPDWQGSGVADQLLQAAEAELAGSQCARITLDTTEPLQRAIRFYEKHGYRATGHIADFFGMPLHEYAKELSDGRGAV